MSNRKIWKRYRKSLVFVFIVFLSACAAPLPPPGGAVTPLRENGLFKSTPSDTDLVREGILYLGSPEQVADYARARSAFDSLRKMYPRSKWRNVSESMIHLIDDMQMCQEKRNADVETIEKAREDKTRLQRDNEQLKKENRALNEKIRSLLQENEQLTKDIELLKSLEVQLEKREKMLR